MLVIIDYGLGNLGSIKNILHKIGSQAVISSDPAVLRQASGLILPGVGAFDHGMSQLRDRQLLPVLNEMVLQHKVPVLGICLGMQLFARASEEGSCSGLGWLDADVVRFRIPSSDLKVPHMGWNYVRPAHQDSLFRELNNPRFYFVHSYHMRCGNSADVLGWARYGYEFAAAVARENVFGTQFHPEKSHKFGMGLLRNYVRHVHHVQTASHTLFAAQQQRAG